MCICMYWADGYLVCRLHVFTIVSRNLESNNMSCNINQKLYAMSYKLQAPYIYICTSQLDVMMRTIEKTKIQTNQRHCPEQSKTGKIKNPEDLSSG